MKLEYEKIILKALETPTIVHEVMKIINDAHAEQIANKTKTEETSIKQALIATTQSEHIPEN